LLWLWFCLQGESGGSGDIGGSGGSGGTGDGCDKVTALTLGLVLLLVGLVLPVCVSYSKKNGSSPVLCDGGMLIWWRWGLGSSPF
jgi:hypothetical protein